MPHRLKFNIVRITDYRKSHKHWNTNNFETQVKEAHIPQIHIPN